MRLNILFLSLLFSVGNFNALAQPTSDFSMSASSGCVNTVVSFTSLATGDVVEWAWDFGDGETSDEINPSHVFSSGGSHTVTLTVIDAGGLTDDRSRTYTVRPPVAEYSFTPHIGCDLPLTVFFTDESYFPDTWNWNFGDGGTSTAQNPIHTYISGGVFHVVLTVSDTNTGCVSSFTDSVTISDLTAEIGGPVSYFGCGPLTAGFENASTNLGAGIITDYLWDFGDGGTSDLSDPTHVYDEPGTYTVSLTVTNSVGCSKTDVNTAYVQVIGPSPAFSADFTAAECTDLTVNFTDESTSGAPITSWAWDFGDGGTSDVPSPIHTYTDYGSYTVSLTINDLDGCSRTFVQNDYILIEDLVNPVFDFCPGDQTESLSVDCNFVLPDYTLLAAVSDNCTDPLVIVQSPVPGTTITANQLITLDIADEAGNPGICSFMVYLIDDINPTIICPPDQNVSFDSDCEYTLLDYTGMAIANDNCLAPVVTQSPIAGTVITATQTITLTATDTAGNTATCNFDVIPVDDIAPTITCPAAITVNNDLGICGAIVTYGTPVGWDNCTPITTQTAGLVSGAEFPVGTTTNTFEVVDGVGLTATCSFDVTVIDVELPTITCPDAISQNNDLGECGAVVSFSDPLFADNCLGAIFSQTSGLTSGVLYPIGTTTNSYEIVDASGNLATCFFDVTITDTEAPTIVCPDNIQTCASIVSFGDPVVSDNCTVESFLMLSGLASGSEFPLGITTNTYQVTDASGNTATCEMTVERFEVPTVDAGSNQTINAGFPVQLDATVSHTVSYNWSPPNGLSDPTLEDPLCNPEMTILYTLTVITENGCEASDDVLISVNLEIEINNFLSPNGDGKNDRWEIKGNYLLDACQIKIVDSWGNLVYESQGYDNNWDGTVQGENLPQGNFYYIIDCGDGNPLTGSITLIR